MKPSINVAIAVFDQVQVLDATGPAQVLAGANEVLGRTHYHLHFLSPGGAPVTASCGLPLMAQPLDALPHPDMLLIPGGREGAILELAGNPAFLDWLKEAAHQAPRVASVCSGAFFLAAAGVLDGRRVATHWEATTRLADMFPALDVDPEAIFVRDGHIWTSAGVTTGIDMALAIVAEDHGQACADAIARNLVVYARRPGSQSQFSPILPERQSASDTSANTNDLGTNDLGSLLMWIDAHLSAPLSVSQLARQAGMTGRTLQRRMKQHTGQSPANYVLRRRLDHARERLSQTRQPAKQVAFECGFTSAETFSRAFLRQFKLTPLAYRRLHGHAAVQR